MPYRIRNYVARSDRLDELRGALVNDKTVAERDPGLVEMRLFADVEQPASIYV